MFAFHCANRMRVVLWLILVTFGWPTSSAFCQVDLPDFGNDAFAQPQDDNPVSLSAEFKIFKDTRYGLLNVRAVIAENWHIFSLTQPPGGPIKTVIKVTESDQFRITGEFTSDVTPHVVEKDPTFGIRVEEHFGEVVFSTPIEIREVVDPKGLKLDVSFKFQTCNERGCLPPSTEKLSAAFSGFTEKPKDFVPPKAADGVQVQPPTKTKSEDDVSQQHGIAPATDSAEQIAAMRKLYDADSKIKYTTLKESTGATTFWPALLGIFVGGILLNLMPCVFPVLGLKVLGFVELGGSDARRVAMHGLAFTLGIVFSMWILAGTILAFKFTLGQDVNWGQQMGNPYFVGAIIILMFVLGLNLAGVFEFGLFMTRLGSAGKKQKGYSGSFFSGVLTTFVATPCSGPFLGAAMSYTLSQDAIVAMLLFTVFALGIALPYLVLSLFPSLIQALPRPGAWMETFKQLMAFALFATAAFFLKTFAKQTGIDGVSWMVMALCVIALAVYLHGHFGLPHLSNSKRYIWGTIVPLAVGGAGFWMYLDSSSHRAPEAGADQIAGLTWEKWYPGKVEQRVSEKRIVWVDYTADW
jgi:thiol:disulfide interchange protein